MYEDPKIINAATAVDDRGRLTFCNDFELHGVKRFYTVTNHRAGFVRAWHGHRLHSTYLWPMAGVWFASTMDMTAPEVRPLTWTLTRDTILHVPSGWFNGHKNLTSGVLGVFSTATIGAVQNDDVREDWETNHPDIWDERQR
jgi:dTDP-4-dehydrorhamnose 3,5-epimerase-like enzyme